MKNHFNYTFVTLEFKGQSTVDEVYKLHLNEFRDTVMAYIGDIESLKRMKLEAMEIVAIIENKITRSKTWLY